MHILQLSIPKATKGFTLYGIGDPHLDKSSTDEAKLRRYVEFIAKDPNGMCICPGDFFDGTLPSHRFFRSSTIKEKDLVKMEEYVSHMVDRTADIFRPLAEAGIPTVFLEGNHDIRIQGVGFVQLICTALNGRRRKPVVQYGGGEVLVDVNAGGVKWLVYGAHGAGGGSLPGGKVNRHQRDAWIADADIFIRGHVAEADVRVVPRYRIVRDANDAPKMTERNVAYYTCSEWAARRIQGVVDYAGRASMAPVDQRVQYLMCRNPMHGHDKRIAGADWLDEWE
jgi:hypothetical protein